MTCAKRSGMLIGLFMVAVVGVGCSDSEPRSDPSENLLSPQLSGITTPTLSPDNPVLIGEVATR
jgi:hypothetical protein